MEKPKKEDYGYESSISFDEQTGWFIEGGEEEYDKALEAWEESLTENVEH